MERVEIRMPAGKAIAHRAGDMWEIDGEPHRVVEMQINMGEGEATLQLDRADNPWRDLRLAVRELRDAIAVDLLRLIARIRGRRS